MSHDILRQLAREKLFQVIDCVTDGFKVVIVDQDGLHVLGSLLKMFEVTAHNVTLVENIDLSRKRFPDMDAIYFLSPTENTINAIIKDFKDPKLPQYKAIHLFFIKPLADDLLDKLGKSNAMKYLKTFKEFFFDFVCFEPSIFITNIPNDFYHFYNKSSTESDNIFKLVATKIVSICYILNELPYIRYLSSSPLHHISERLARHVQTLLETESLPTGKLDLDLSSLSKNRGTLLIIDRSFDSTSPLLHEFTYQSMANDLLDLQDGKYLTLKHADKNKVVLDESDSLWTMLKHSHIAEVTQQLLQSFQEFLKQNAAAQKAVQTNKPGADSKDVMKSLLEMKKTISSIPQLQEMKTRYAAHIYMTEQCMARFKNENIALVATQEQNLATGQNSEGQSIRHESILKDIMALLINDSITSNAKTRLIMLYFITKGQIDPEEQKTLIKCANLNSNDAQAIENLSMLGIPSLGQVTGIAETAKSLKKSKKIKKSKDDQVSYELSRYNPPLTAILEDFCLNKLSSMNIPTLPDPPGIVSALKGGHDPSKGTSLRQKATYQHSPSISKTVNVASHPKLILFIIGGITYSEILTLYKTAHAKQRDLILGGTHILTPRTFIQELASLSGIHNNEESKGKHKKFW